MVSFINELDHYKLTGEFLSVEEMNGGKAEEAKKSEEPEEEEAEPEVVETIAEENNDCAFHCIFFIGFVIVCHLIYYGKYQLLLVDKATLCV
jgi:hypothetical protein